MCRRQVLHTACALAIAGLLAGAGPLCAQPSLTHAVPAAACPGRTVELTLHGAKLDPPLKVWSSFAAQIEVLPAEQTRPEQKTLRCKITLPADAPCGVGGLIVTNRAGASDPLLVMVDDLPSLADNGTNHTRESAQEIPALCAVDGTSDGVVFDYYKFAAKAGQRLSIEVVAARLGADFDPVMRLLDPSGRELVVVDDDMSLGADCRLSHTFAADGVYIVELRDNRYKSGGHYRLRVGDFPLISTPFPLGVPVGGQSQIGAAGPAVEGVPSAIQQGSATALGAGQLFSARFPGGQSAGFATLAVSDLAEIVEGAPISSAESFTAANIPAALNGRLAAPREVDTFQFQATGGTRLTFKSVTRSLQSPTIPKLRLLTAAGALLAESAVTEAEDESMTLVAPETGLYRLQVSDLLRRGGPEFTYRIEARTGGSFSLHLKPDKGVRTNFVLPRKGGTFTLAVQVVRNGYDGPIALGISAPHSAWQVANNVIPDKGVEAKLVVTPPTDVPELELVPLQVVGQAMVDGREFSATAKSTQLLRAARPQMPFPPVWLDGLVTVCVLPEAAP